MTVKTKPSSTPEASRSSFDRFARIGATRGATKSAPSFPTHGVVIPCDAEHPEYENHNPWRYSRENPVIQRWMKQIEAADGELMQDPKGSTIVGFPNKLYIWDGGSRIAALRHINENRVERGESEFEVAVRVTFNDTLASFRRKYRAANLERQPDDAVTQAKKARQMLLGDDANNVEPVAAEQVCEEFNWDISYLEMVVDEQSGLVALSERWVEAVAQGTVTEKAALTAAKLAAEAGDDPAARHAVQDDLLGKAEAEGKKITPALLKALARGEAPPEKKPAPPRITTADRTALSFVLRLLTVDEIAAAAEIPTEEAVALLGKFGVPVDPAEMGAKPADAPATEAASAAPVTAPACEATP